MFNEQQLKVQSTEIITTIKQQAFIPPECYVSEQWHWLELLKVNKLHSRLPAHYQHRGNIQTEGVRYQTI